jgi:probable phosphoglycerate mutase
VTTAPADHPADRPARRLVLLRHGRTHWNHVRRAQGHADVPLDDVGRAQAGAVAPLLAALRPARIWSSDLPRARQTAEAVAAVCGLPVEEDRRLREFAVGERQGLTWAEAVERFPWIADGVGLGEQLAGVPGAETDADVTARIVPAVQEMAAVLHPGEAGVLVSHGAAIKLALVGLLGWGTDAARSLAVLGNCQWATVLLQDGRGAKLVDYGVGDFATREGIG